jgi:hypothetical protein
MLALNISAGPWGPSVETVGSPCTCTGDNNSSRSRNNSNSMKILLVCGESQGLRLYRQSLWIYRQTQIKRLLRENVKKVLKIQDIKIRTVQYANSLCIVFKNPIYFSPFGVYFLHFVCNYYSCEYINSRLHEFGHLLFPSIKICALSLLIKI